MTVTRLCTLLLLFFFQFLELFQISLMMSLCIFFRFSFELLKVFHVIRWPNIVSSFYNFRFYFVPHFQDNPRILFYEYLTVYNIMFYQGGYFIKITSNN